MAVSESTYDTPPVTPPVTDQQEAHDTARAGGSSHAATLLVCLGSAYQDATAEQLDPVVATLHHAFGTRVAETLLAFPSSREDSNSFDNNGLLLQPYRLSLSPHSLAIHTASAWVAAYELVRAHRSDCCLLLGAEAQTLDPESMRLLADAVLVHSADLAVPRYTMPANQGLINAAITSPLSRAIYNAKVRFPLTLDVAFSARMAERMAAAAQRFTANNQGDAIVWPVAEAAAANFSIAEIGTGPREIPQPTDDLAQILSMVAGSLFADVEAKAALWQRTRPAKEVARFNSAQSHPDPAPGQQPDEDEIQSLIDTFRLGYSNLHEIWSLVLPPNTLVALKRLSQAPRETFALTDALWVRIVYDFVLAHRLRTLSRGHLLGAFTPLYLAWVASRILATQQAPDTDGEHLARAFEADKPYLVSRWRWPDRFNP